MMQYTLQPLAWFVVLAVLMSFIEHQIHRSLMHRKNILSGRLPAFKKVFEHHAILHHGHYHKIFHDEPVSHGQDRHLRLSMKEGFLEALPISVLMTTISWQGALTLLIVVCLHHFIWNQIHMEMHKPEKRFFSHWSTYKFLARYITCITDIQTRTSMLFYRLQTLFSEHTFVPAHRTWKKCID